MAIEEVERFRLPVSQLPFRELLARCGHSRDLIPIDTEQRSLRPDEHDKQTYVNISDEGGGRSTMIVALVKVDRYTPIGEVSAALELARFRSVGSRPHLSFGVAHPEMVAGGGIIAFGTTVVLHSVMDGGGPEVFRSRCALVLAQWPNDDPLATRAPHLLMHPLVDRLAPTTRILVECPT